MKVLPLMLLLAPACFELPILNKGAREPNTCDGEAVRGLEQVALQLTTLGYGDFDTGGLFGDPGLAVYTDAERWAERPESSAVEVDFSRQAVLTNAWVDGGCSDSYQYTAWRLGDGVRAAAWGFVSGGCDAYFPQLDILVVETGGSADVAWCGD